MPLQKTNELDCIGIDKKTGMVTLAIIDSLDWSNEEEHLLLLQEKINVYLSFIESGEVYSVYEHATGREFEIKVHFKNEIPPVCEEFLRIAGKIIAEAGFILTHKIGS